MPICKKVGDNTVLKQPHIMETVIHRQQPRLVTHQGNNQQGKFRGAPCFLFSKYTDHYAQSKVLNFMKGFLEYQARLTLESRYLAFDMFLEKSKRARSSIQLC